MSLSSFRLQRQFTGMLGTLVAAVSSRLLSFGCLKTPTLSTFELTQHLKGFVDRKYSIFPKFLQQEDLHEIYSDLIDRLEAGDMADAGIKGSLSSPVASYHSCQQKMIFPAIRKTSIVWLDNLKPKSDIESKLLLYMDTFRMQLGNLLNYELDFEDTEMLYARYPIGGFYKKHSDSHAPGPGISARDTERKLSFILYLNENDWMPEDGGELRMYGVKNNLWPLAIDVPPTPGTLLLFLSEDFEHEVLETTVNRNAVVGWFRVRTVPSLVARYFDGE